MQIITFIRAAKKLLYILNSLLFDGAAHYLTRTPSTAGNRKTLGFDCWAKIASFGTVRTLFAAYIDINNHTSIGFNGGNYLFVQIVIFGTAYTWLSDAAFADASAHSHFAISIDTTASSGNRLDVFANGVELSGAWGTEVPLNSDLAINSTNVHYVGARDTGSGVGAYFDGPIALPRLIDGTSPVITDLLSFDGNNYISPKTYTGSYGTNGFLLDFADNSTAAALGTDVSGNGNDFTVSGIATTDQLADTPTDDVTLGIGNFATLNPDTSTPNWTFSNGNLTVTNASESNHRLAYATQAVEEGKFYWEVTIPSAPFIDSIGVINMDIFADGVSAYLNTYGCGWGYSTSVGRWDAGGGWSSSGSAPPALTSNGVIGIALDCDNDKLWFRNASGWINSGDPAAGTGENFNRLTKFPVAPAFSKYNNAGAYTFNFGQKAFTYTPPTGFSKLATQNLPAGHPLYVAGAAQLRAGVQVMSYTLNADSGGNADYHFRTEIVAAQIVDHSFTRVRIRMEAASVEACEIDAIYIGTKAGSGNAWDYAGDQVQVTVNGNGAFTIPAGTEIWSDWIGFSGDGTGALIVGWDHSSNIAADGFRQVTGTGIFNRWGKSATDAAATTAPSGLTLQSGTLGLVNAIEVQ